MQKLFSTLFLLTLSFSAFAQLETEEETKDKYLTNVPITINSEAAPNSTARVMMRNPDIYVKMLNNVFVYAAPKEGLDRPGYFLVLFEGENADLYKKISKEFIEGMAATTSLTRDIPSSYKEKEAYYLLNKNTNSFQEFPSSRNAKFGLFDDKKKELKTYTKEERLNINKEYALIKLVKYYNTL